MTETQPIKLSLRKTVKISQWKVEVGTIVYDGRVLLLYEEVDEPEDREKTKKIKTGNKLKSKNVGTVAKIVAKEGTLVSPGDVLLEIDVGCTHPTVINDLCAECGADLQKDGQSQSFATIPMVHSIPGLKVSHEQAQRIGRADTERLLHDRKLVLLVDLDQTLIHTTHDPIPNNLKDVHHFQLCPGAASPWYHTRLRPGTASFLKSISTLYELHICTFGVRPYAHTIARILDSDGSLFSNRILSRDECFRSDTKFANLQALFPCGDELVCIIDDRDDVWNFSPNLIQVKPYQFFRSVTDIHDPSVAQKPLASSDDYLAPGVHLKKEKKKVVRDDKEVEVDESVIDSDGMLEVEDEDDYLMYLESILKRVHQKFYKVYDKELDGVANVKWVIADECSSVLKGCTLVLSGLVPLQVPSSDSSAALLARRLGATVDEELSEKTTHLIAANKGTAKVHAAKKMKGVHIVSPHWLLTTAHRWEKVDEALFEIGTGGPVPFCKPVPMDKFGQPQSAELPQFLTLSQEEMEAMALEVNEDEDSLDEDEDDEKNEENGSMLKDDSEEEEEEEEWSQLGAEIEKGLSDYI